MGSLFYIVQYVYTCSVEKFVIEKMFRNLQKKKKQHRGVLDLQVSDLFELERENPTSDRKEHLIQMVVKKKVTL